jgi:hypothetical protein
MDLVRSGSMGIFIGTATNRLSLNETVFENIIKMAFFTGSVINRQENVAEKDTNGILMENSIAKGTDRQ